MKEKPVKPFHTTCGTTVSKLKEGYFCPTCSTYTIDKKLAFHFVDVAKYIPSDTKYMPSDIEETYQDDE
jgi:hypothetical protein